MDADVGVAAKSVSDFTERRLQAIRGYTNHDDREGALMTSPVRRVVPAIFDSRKCAKGLPNPPVGGFLLANCPPIPPRDGEEFDQ
jgi:hypothetical protein